MRRFCRIILGKQHAFFQECFTTGYVGLDHDIPQDLTDQLPDDWRPFNKKFIPIYLERNPERTRIAAGLACGNLWTVCKGLVEGDIVLCPDGTGIYQAGEVTSNYIYAPNESLPHRRSVRWLDLSIARDAISDDLRTSLGSAGTVVWLDERHREEIELLLEGKEAPRITTTDKSIEDPATFALEKHLEDFLVANWNATELSDTYEIYEDDNEKLGQQYPTDTGPIDILAVSKDRKTILVIELKRGRASDVVVGQTLRYMGFVKDELAEPDQDVRGLVIALKDDQRLRRALTMTPAIEFKRYEVSFKLLQT